METDYLTSLPSADLGGDRQILGTSVEPLNSYMPMGKMQYDTTVRMYDQFCGESLLAECMPQLADVLSAGYMQYDDTVPANLFSDGEESSEEECSPLITSSVSAASTTTSTPTPISSSASSLVPDQGLLQPDPLDSANFDFSNYALPKPTLGLEAVQVPPVSTSQLDSINVENLFNLAEDFKISESDFACLDLDAVGTSLFENGIDAQDMGSLLEQFEKAAANLPDIDENLPLPISPKKEARIILKTEPQKPPAKSPVAQTPTDSEVMRLLMTKTPTSSSSASTTKSESPASEIPARRSSQSSSSSSSTSAAAPSSSSSSSTSSSSRASKSSRPSSSAAAAATTAAAAAASSARLHKFLPVASKPISMNQRPPSSLSTKQTSASSKPVTGPTQSAAFINSLFSKSKSLAARSASSASKQKQDSKAGPSPSSSKSTSRSFLSSKSGSLSAKSTPLATRTSARLSKAGKSKASTPPPEVIEKIKASTKRKSTIMLPSVVPSKSQRGSAMAIPSGSRQRRPDSSQPTSLHKELSVNTKGLNKSSSASAPCSPSVRTKTPTATYSAPVSPTQTPTGTPNKSSMRTSRSETNMSAMVKEEPEAIVLSSDFFDLIVDHDYCLNSRNPSRHPSPTNSAVTSPVTSKTMGTSDSLETGEDQDGSVLKSLLLNKNLAEQLKRQAAEQRACIKRKVSVNLDVVDMELDEPDSARFSKFVGERKDLGEATPNIAVGMPLPPLPPLDQLPKDHEIRALEEKSSSSTESLRPANDMNFILNEAKRMMEGRHNKNSERKAQNLDDKNSDSNESVNSTHMSDFLKRARRVIKAGSAGKSEGNTGVENSPDSSESLQSASEMNNFLNKAKRLIKSCKQPKSRQVQSFDEKSTDSNDSLKSAADMNSFLNSATVGPTRKALPKEESVTPETVSSESNTSLGHSIKLKRIPKIKSQSKPQLPDENLFDKLPNYFTALTKPAKQDKAKMENARQMYNSVPTLDRDPSPERDSGYNKLPTYFCFTNSVKYDDSDAPAIVDPAQSVSRNTEASAHETEASQTGAVNTKADSEELSSRSPTPSLTIVSRANSEARSRPTSRAPSPDRPRSRSNSGSPSSSSSRSCSSSCKSRSASSERSPSPAKTMAQRGRSARKRTFRRKRHSYSSSHSSSCSRSRSRSRSRLRSPKASMPSSWSRSRSRSRSKSQSRSRSRSGSRCQSRSGSRQRDLQRRGERVRRDFNSRREEDRVLEKQDKKKQIEERRIVYVGCIPSNFTRRDLRRQFDCFGEVEDVSVHFREHGGDNYGFVTFAYTCDAFSAIEKGKTIPSMSRYDLCFGGRREFCKTEYADLDGDMEMEEEMAPVTGRSSGPVDFDELLRQAMKKKTKEPAKKGH